MPGIIVNTPAAASKPQSIPAAPTVLVMIAAIGYASIDVSVLANNNSTQENRKQQNAVTPIPERNNSKKIHKKNFGKL